ncbi:PREDICTED: SH2 domain-containing protein 3C-like [Nanorana parkeri]|uniref:SH2 domain-containing protein 3C-like n=1 Tax=Nanorana parkeri TaxID=125878 RepID=UPI0008544808|nr:PREDICTED: SH2 domain-containing protein 3C-like [Nanorana parkeri]
MGDTSAKKSNAKKFKLFKLNVFGSLSSLPRAFRRRQSQDTNLSSNASFDNILEKTQDDLTSIPRSPSYARSSDMYSHMGTMPRFNKKTFKSKREKSRPDPPPMMSQSVSDLLDDESNEIIVVPSVMAAKKAVMKTQGSNSSVTNEHDVENDHKKGNLRSDPMDNPSNPPSNTLYGGKHDPNDLVGAESSRKQSQELVEKNVQEHDTVNCDER